MEVNFILCKASGAGLNNASLDEAVSSAMSFLYTFQVGSFSVHH
jgi:hypothetical protein